VSQILTKYLPDEQRKRLHPDFLKNEQQYWQMRDQLLLKYGGQWVAFHQGQVVAVGQDLFDITDQVGQLDCHAYIAKVGEEDQVCYQLGSPTKMELVNAMKIADRIEVNPEICLGKPVIQGTRIPVYLILDLLAGGLTVEEITQQWYPQLTREDVLACIRYANSLVQNEEIYPVEA
jgi:uncharacterized protein (DUF433 family)